MYLNQKWWYNMCHRLRRSSRRDVIQLYRLKNWVAVVNRARTSKIHNIPNNLKTHLLSSTDPSEAIQGGQSISKEYASTNLADLFTNTMAELKREGLLNKFTYWEANCIMWDFYPSEVLSQAMNLLESEISKLDCYIYITKGTDLI